MSASNYLENEILDHIFGGAAYTSPSNIYVKLHTGDPGEDGTSNAATETTRVAATFGTASSGSITTTADVEWTSVAATETYTHISVWDALTGGNNLGSGALTASKAVTLGDTFRIPSGSLTITAD